MPDDLDLKAIEHAGRTQSLYAWSLELGIGYPTLRMRLADGWSVERTLSTPILPKGSVPRGAVLAETIKELREVLAEMREIVEKGRS